MIKFFNKYLKEIKIFFSLILIVYLYNKVNFEIFLTYLINLDIFFFNCIIFNVDTRHNYSLFQAKETTF